MTKIMTVIGARPQFVKAAVVSRLIRSEAWTDRFSEILVHTGQHYDENMSAVFFREMRIPEPDVNLGIGGGSHGEMTGRMLLALENLILERKPDLVLVYGDTNSTLAGALAASKLLVPVAHVEAGLRSFNKMMPEEQNRILTDRLSTWLLCPTDTAVRNLSREGMEDPGPGTDPTADYPRIVNVGDVMYDASLFYRSIAAARPTEDRILRRLGIDRPFHLLTMHRAENTDDRGRLASILSALGKSGIRSIVFPLHPRTRKMLETFGMDVPGNIRVIEPVGFLDMLDLEESSTSIITDSGGVQKEAYFFGKPCITLRNQTEWTETVESGWNCVVGADPEKIVEAVSASQPSEPRPLLYGDGNAGNRILEVLAR